MKLPDSVYVMGHKYDIVEMPNDNFIDDEAYGHCNLNRRVITIYTNVHPTIIRDTLLHEILHACWHMLSLNKTEEEEKAVNSIATALIGVIDDPRNKDITKLIFQG
jgi:Zn-dependent peptidase ImmA (M78 family)